VNTVWEKGETLQETEITEEMESEEEEVK